MTDSQTVLVTGGEGFTGGYLIDALRASGKSVFALSRFDKSDEDASFYHAPLENITAIKSALKDVRPNYIIHLAGISFTNHDDALNYYDTNVLGTENLLKACLDECPNVKKIILASSAAVYGNPKVDFISEDQLLRPISHYGCSKLAMEHIARTYMDELPILMTRPFNYTGPGQNKAFIVPKIVEHFRGKKTNIALGNIDVIREFSDVRDVSQNYIALLESAENGAVNLTSGTANQFHDIIKTLQELTGHEISITINPKFVRKNDIDRLVGDDKRLQKLTGRTPQFKLKQTLQDMLNTPS